MSRLRKYRRREVSMARRLEEDERIVGTNGAVDAPEGSWVVTQEIDGRSYVYVLDNESFNRDWVAWRSNPDDDDDGTEPEPTFVTNGENEDETPPAPIQSVETQQPETETVTRTEDEENPAPVATTEVAQPLTHTVRAAADNIVTEHDAPVVTVVPGEPVTEDDRAAAEVSPVNPDSAPVRATETVARKRTLAGKGERASSQNDSEQDTQTGKSTERNSETNSGDAAKPLPPVGSSLETSGPASSRNTE